MLPIRFWAAGVVLVVSLTFSRGYTLLPRPAVHVNASAIVASDDNQKIVGGIMATAGQFPWQTQVTNGHYFCGGSLLSPEYVLTAQHCTSGKSGLRVGWGTLKLHDPSMKWHNVAEVYEYPGFSMDTLSNDISILKLSEPIQGVKGTSSVQLPVQSAEPEAGLKVDVSGWGLNREGASKLSDFLEFVHLQVFDRTKCNSIYEGAITQSMVCAGYEGGKGVCQGDSGGALVNEHKVQIGIVSWGYKCAAQGIPQVYTNVAQFSDWIKETMAGKTKPVL